MDRTDYTIVDFFSKIYCRSFKAFHNLLNVYHCKKNNIKHAFHLRRDISIHNGQMECDTDPFLM